MTPRLPFLVLLLGATVVGVGLTVGETLGSGSESREQLTIGASDAKALPGVERETLSTWYCAAGTVGGLANHTVVLNNHTTSRIDGQLTMFSSAGPLGADQRDHRGLLDGSGRAHPLVVPADGEVRVELAEFVEPRTGEADGRATGDSEGSGVERHVAALVELEAEGVVVDHEVEGAHGRSEGPCVTQGSSEWHFAWGTTTRDAQDLMTLFNPFPSDVVVDVVFSTPDGVREPVRWQGLVVPARRVVVIDVADDVTRQEQVAASVRARNGSLVAERLQILDGSVGVEGMWLLEGSHTLVETASFPGGGLDQDDRELIALYNPQDVTAEVDVIVEPEDADAVVPEAFRLVIRPGRSQFLDLANEDRVDAGKDHVTEVHSTNGVPVVADHILLGGDP